MNKLVSIQRPPAYESDGYGWAMAQAELLRARHFEGIDWDNVAEEIESMGKSERNALVSNLTQVIMHMMKWDVQPNKRSRSWVVSIGTHRVHALQILDENPSLRASLDDVMLSAHRYARKLAAVETSLPPASFDNIQFSDAEVWDRDCSL
jgi:hypothetical protein